MKILAISVDVLTDGLCNFEIKGCSLYALDLARGNEVSVGGKISISIELKNCGTDASCRIACKVEVCVVSHIDDGSLIGGCVVVDHPAVLIGKSVSNRKIKVSGESLVSVGREDVKLDNGLLGVNSLNVKDLLVKAYFTAVAMVACRSGGVKLIVNTVKSELSLGYTVCPSADNCALIAVSVEVRVKAVKSADKVGKAASSVGCPKLCNDAAVVEYLDGHSVFIYESVAIYLSTVGKLSVKFLSDAHF